MMLRQRKRGKIRRRLIRYEQGSAPLEILEYPLLVSRVVDIRFFPVDKERATHRRYKFVVNRSASAKNPGVACTPIDKRHELLPCVGPIPRGNPDVADTQCLVLDLEDRVHFDRNAERQGGGADGEAGVAAGVAKDLDHQV